MVLHFLWQQVAVAVAGGIAAEGLHWYTLVRQGKPVPKYMRSVLYCATSAFMVAVGGLMPVLYNSGSASAALCFHLGAATPLLLAKLIASIPAIAQEQGMVDRSSATFRGFIDW